MDDFINSSSQSKLIHRYLDLLAERTAALERKVSMEEIRQLRQENRELREQLARLEEKDQEFSENFFVAGPSETENIGVDDEFDAKFSWYIDYCWLGKFMACIFRGSSDSEWYSLGISNVIFLNSIVRSRPALKPAMSEKVIPNSICMKSIYPDHIWFEKSSPASPAPLRLNSVPPPRSMLPSRATATTR